jgi:hypothetical protein
LCYEEHTIVRDSESDFRSTYERIRRLYKAPGDIQILCVRSKVSLRIEGGYLNTGNEWKTLRAMASERNVKLPRFLSKFYSKRRTPGSKRCRSLSI